MAGAQAALSTSRQQIARWHGVDERECMAMLLQTLHGPKAQGGAAELPWCEARAQGQARVWVEAMRQERSRAWGLDALMQEYALSSAEGVALMCLAEGLLRIPDVATRDHLIRDALQRGEWSQHLGHSQSWSVNAATWGLVLAGHWVQDRTWSETHLLEASRSLLAKGGDALLRHAMEYVVALMGQQFVMAQTIEEAVTLAQEGHQQGFCYSFDMLGEAALHTEDAQHYFALYRHAIHAVGAQKAFQDPAHGLHGDGVSIKLSALHPRYEWAQQERVLAELYPRLLELAMLAKHHDIDLTVDAEECERLELSLLLFERLCLEPCLQAWDGLGFVVQAYQTRALAVVDHLAVLARVTERVINVRLVKGAYWDGEIKKAQQEGLSHYPVFTYKAATDLCYLVCAQRLLGHRHVLYAQFATHNALSCAQVLQLAQVHGDVPFEMQGLFGMGQTLYQQVLQTHPGLNCRLYAPVGAHHSLLPYLVRRLLENGANSSFVNQVLNDTLPLETVLQNPVSLCAECIQQPDWAGLPLPTALYHPGRDNSEGLDLSNEQTLRALQAALHTLEHHEWVAMPQLGLAEPLMASAPSQPRMRTEVYNPAKPQDCVGLVHWATLADLDHAMRAAHAQVEHWSHTPAPRRAELLLRVANALQNNQAMILSLLVREAGKTIPAALGEWREAIDFCRYYAWQLLSIEQACPSVGVDGGVAACIAPWNFPLAMVVGQMASALAAGLCVVIKPAEQTPLVAHFVVSLCHQAGIGHSVLQCLPGDGSHLGAALAAHPWVDTVLFTGSLVAARQVAALQLDSFAARQAQLEHQAQSGNALAALRFPLLVAETGGINAMVVDSSALPEQVVHDVLRSAFDSAGQRCSALRLLCVQIELAPRLLAMLRGAMAELAVGNPASLCHDLGPLISPEAAQGVRDHVQAMQCRGHRVDQAGRIDFSANGPWVLPTLIEVTGVDDVQEEVFGPVLHVCTFASQELPGLLQQLERKGYALTFGLHSRLQDLMDACVQRVSAGNIYINRNMIGAVVGTQPFGGQGLSGTGPKAGGPLMLPRLMRIEADLSQLGLYLEQACTLPGPTGEHNTWCLLPRGLLWCTATQPEGLRAQLELVQRTGNQACVLASDWLNMAQQLANWPKALKCLLSTFSSWPQPPNELRGLVVERDAQRYLAVQRHVLQHGQGLLPVVLQHADGQYPCHWARREQVVCNNTAALGGNAALMTASPPQA